MKLYLKQKVFSWGDKFHLYDENGETCYTVEGEVFTLGKKLHVYDVLENEAAYIHQEVWSFLPRFYIERPDGDKYEVIKEFTFLHPCYTVSGLNWTVEGDFWAHDYNVIENGRVVVDVSKVWFTWGDLYEINIDDSVDEVTALCVVLVIDAVLAQEAAAAAAH
ncbi:MAG: LURP-one-related family protein [Erysipelotrichaceae bacterium]|nr:LURP-one-related family protein [Erysipelotrichaceae bacterium]